MEEYGKKEYWEERYIKHALESFEWFVSYNDIDVLIEKYIKKKKDIKIVDLGCGNSKFLFDFTNEVTKSKKTVEAIGVDNSKEVVRIMNKRMKDLNNKHVTYRVLDLSEKFDFGLKPIDLFIDKSTMDSILHDKDKGTIIIQNMLTQAACLLNTDGAYIMITQMDINKEEDDEFFKKTVFPCFDLDGFRFLVHIHNSQGSDIKVYSFIKKQAHIMKTRHKSSIEIEIKQFFH